MTTQSCVLQHLSPVKIAMKSFPLTLNMLGCSAAVSFDLRLAWAGQSREKTRAGEGGHCPSRCTTAARRTVVGWKHGVYFRGRGMGWWLLYPWEHQLIWWAWKLFFTTFRPQPVVPPANTLLFVVSNSQKLCILEKRVGSCRSRWAHREWQGHQGSAAARPRCAPEGAELARLTFGVPGVRELVLPHADCPQHLHPVGVVRATRCGRVGRQRGGRLPIGGGCTAGQGGRGQGRRWWRQHGAGQVAIAHCPGAWVGHWAHAAHGGHAEGLAVGVQGLALEVDHHVAEGLGGLRLELVVARHQRELGGDVRREGGCDTDDRGLDVGGRAECGRLCHPVGVCDEGGLAARCHCGDPGCCTCGTKEGRQWRWARHGGRTDINTLILPLPHSWTAPTCPAALHLKQFGIWSPSQAVSA